MVRSVFSRYSVALIMSSKRGHLIMPVCEPPTHLSGYIEAQGDGGFGCSQFRFTQKAADEG